MAKSKLEKGIIELLPQIPYVIDQIGEALKWAKEELSEGEYNKTLKVAYEVAQYAKEVSDPNFFKTHLVIASILSNIENPMANKKFEIFDTASKATEKALKDLVIDKKEIEDKGCFKSVLLRLVPLAKKDENLFATALIGIKHDLEEVVEAMKKANVETPITAHDYVTILGYAFVMDNIRMARLNLLEKAWKVYNDITVLLNGIRY